MAFALATWLLPACARSFDTDPATAPLLCRDLVAVGIPCRSEGAAVHLHAAHVHDARRVLRALSGAAELINSDATTQTTGAGPAAFRATRQREGCAVLMETGDIWACDAGGSGRIIFVGPSGLTNELSADDEVREIPLPTIRAVGLRPIGPMVVTDPNYTWVRLLLGASGVCLCFVGVQRWESARFAA